MLLDTQSKTSQIKEPIFTQINRTSNLKDK